MEFKKRIERCKYSHPSWQDLKSYHCVVEGWDKEQVKTVTEEDCDACLKYKSRYIEYPLTIQGIENKPIEKSGIGHTCGALCKIRPCQEEYQGRTYLGIYLGDLPITIVSSYNEENGVLTNRTMKNPAIFVPELKKIIYGMESWWREIESEDDLKEITQEDIENVWYVKALKEIK